MVALKRRQYDESAGTLAKAAKTSAATSTQPAVALLLDSDLLSPPLGGPLQDSIARCLEAAEDPDGEEQRLQALLAAFAGIKKGFPGTALERAVQARPTLLAEADASMVQELLGLLARSCLLPGRVVEMVAARPDMLILLDPVPLAEQIAHLKGETTPMGSQVACLWQKFPQSLWLTIADIDERLAWLRGLGVPDDRIRFLYAREPVFTASIDSFKQQLDFMSALLPPGSNQRAVGALLGEKPQYLTASVPRLEKMRDKIERELRLHV